MGSVWRRLGARYAIGLGLAVIVAVVVVVAQLVSPSSNDGLISSGGTETPRVVATGQPDDGDPSPVAPVPPQTKPGEATPQIVATEFATAWLHHDGVTATDWYDSLEKLCTTNLKDQLNGADPASVPADRIVGTLTIVDFAASYTELRIPANGGTITLGMRRIGGRWLVDTVDWTIA